MTNSPLKLTHLWIEGVFDIENNWDRLRVIGSAENLGDGIAQIAFYPIRQRIPALSIITRPEMKDDSTAQILAEYNTLAYLCEIFPPQKSDLMKETPSKAGKMLKLLLRMSNYSNRHIFTDLSEIPSALSVLGQNPSQLFEGTPIIDVHAFEEKILIAGGPIGNVKVWPEGYSVIDVDFTKQGFDYRGPVGENIVVSTKISDYELGKLVLAVWKAKISVLGI